MLKDQKLKAIFILLFLSPFCGEVLSTSTDFFVFLLPWVFIPLILLYGFGALIFRELMIKWKKGCLSLIIWGAAYGIIEEGLILRTFFNPNWPDLGVLSTYGRVWGINLVWVSELIVFHSILSITIPVVLTQLMFPQISQESWLSEKSFKAVVATFLLVSAPLFYMITSYVAPLVQYIIFIAVTIFLIILGKQVKSPTYSRGELLRSNKTLFLLGLIMTPVFFFIVYLSPIFGLPWVIPFILLFLWPMLIFRLADPSLGQEYAWSQKQILSFVVGIISFMIFFTPLISPDFVGQLIVAIIITNILVILWVKSE
ncbi:MAG: hypothetical protein ACP6IS_07660 [Candidatus Asgardarchaeia archaeon]